MALKVQGYLGLDGSGFFQTLNRADASVSRFSRNITTGLGARMAGLFSVGAMGLAIRKTIEYGGKLTDLSAQTGVAVEQLQKFDRAASENGSSLESLVKFWNALNKARKEALDNPTGTKSQSFSALGISRKDLQTKGADEITQQIAVAWKTSSNVEGLVAPLKDIGERSAMELGAAFEAGMLENYQNISVMTSDQAEVLDELGDKWDSFSKELMVNLAPAIIDVIDSLKVLWDNFVIGASVVQGFATAVITAFSETFEKFGFGEGKTINPAKLAYGFGESMMKASKEAWKNTDDIAVGVAAEREEKNAAEKAAREAKIRARGRKQTDFDGKTDIEQAIKQPKINSDSLVSVGNFLGTGPNLISAIERQTMILSDIRTNTKPRTAPTTDTIGLPPS